MSMDGLAESGSEKERSRNPERPRGSPKVRTQGPWLLQTELGRSQERSYCLCRESLLFFAGGS